MGTLHTLTPPGPPTGPKPVLPPWKRLDVEQARQLLDGLPDRTAGAELPAAMFLLGELAGHARQLLEVLDSVVTP